MTEGEGGWGEVRNTKIWVSRERREFLVDDVKSIFYNYLRVIMCWIK